MDGPRSVWQPIKESARTKTELDVLKEQYRFIRDDDARATSWEEALAAKYEANLFKEFAVCDLKHYKSGNIALQWRTESQVLSGAGESTCGNIRCPNHPPSTPLGPSSSSASRSHRHSRKPRLNTLEVPFAYVERGESKSALVKLVLCEKCTEKMMYNRRKEKERITELERDESSGKKDVDASGPYTGVGENEQVVSTKEGSSSANQGRTSTTTYDSPIHPRSVRRRSVSPSRGDKGSSRSRDYPSRYTSSSHSITTSYHRHSNSQRRARSPSLPPLSPPSSSRRVL